MSIGVGKARHDATRLFPASEYLNERLGYTRIDRVENGSPNRVDTNCAGTDDMFVTPASLRFGRCWRTGTPAGARANEDQKSYCQENAGHKGRPSKVGLNGRRETEHLRRITFDARNACGE
jgi:hypothetical protein